MLKSLFIGMAMLLSAAAYSQQEATPKTSAGEDDIAAVILYKTVDDFIDGKGEAFLDAFKESYCTGTELIYVTNDGRKTFKIAKLEAWGMKEGKRDVYRFFPKVWDSLEVKPSEVKDQTRYMVNYIGPYFVTYGSFFISNDERRGLSSSFTPDGDCYISAGLDGNIYNASWSNLAALVRNNEELYNEVMKRNTGKMRFKSRPKTDEELTEYVAIMIQYEQSLKER